MKLLQTPYMQSPGFLSIVFRALTIRCSPFNRSIFLNVSFHSSVIKMLHFILLSDISWLVKLRVSSLESNPNKLLAFHFFINLFFVLLYTFPGIYLPFLSIIGWNSPCSHKHCLLSIRNFLFPPILACSDYKWSQGFIEILFWAHHSSTNNKSF